MELKDTISDLNKMQLTESYFKKHFNEYYDFIISLPPQKFQEKLYWYINDIKEYPKCKCCGKLVKFRCFTQGYRTYCSSKCQNSDPDKINRTKQTNLEKYGFEAPAKSPEIQEKSKQTCVQKYGTSYATQSNQIKEKIKETNRKKYGVDWVGSCDDFRIKTQQTCIERYGGVGVQSAELLKKKQQTSLKRHGDPNYSNNQQSVETQIKKYGGVGNQSQILKQKYQSSVHEKYINEKDFLLGYTKDGDWICKCPHPECDKCEEKTYIINGNRYGGRIKEGAELCTKLLPIQPTHSSGTTIELFIRNILDKYGVEYEANVAIFDGQHADIYIPSKKIAIETNGIYYHSTLVKSKLYHINKYKNALNKGIQLITFWSDQIYNHPQIVESILLTKLGLCNNTIYARKCIIKEVKSIECANFLKNNHIQGSTPTSIRLGLYYNDELVSLMTFAKQTGCQGSKTQQYWTLNRFCNKLNTRVVGGASKLLHHFIKKHNPSSIVSYSHNDISNGNLYKKLGFHTDFKINTSYYYIKGNQRWHRSTFTKAGIVRRGWKDKIDSSWTEAQVMKEHKYLCIYDSGTIKWILQLNGFYN